MFKKVHLRLTLLCAGITAMIMIIMSLCYLHISERGLYNNQFQSFKNDINTIATNLEQQSVISMEWLSKMESKGNYTFFLLDNEIPFLYNQLSTKNKDYDKNMLLKEALNAYHSIFDVSTSALPTAHSPYLSYHLEYEFVSPSTKENYFGSVITMERGSSILQVIILFSLKSLEDQILQQRIRFLLIDAASILLLTVFSFTFTGKLLKPIMKNQQKQIDFISAVSHELRTPLSIILSAAECCKDADINKQQDFIKIIRQEGIRMSALINDMLTLSLSDSHRFSISFAQIELDTLLINSYEAFLPLANEKSLSLSLDLPQEFVPPCFADAERISQVISILLHNAISYTPEKGKIELSLCFDKKNFYLSVRDNGIGISEEDKKRIFDRFYRVEKARSTKGHFGLGLPIAYEIVKSHHGSLSVTDAPGGGAIFTVKLPQGQLIAST